VAAVTSGDNSNILTARIARENYGVPSVVARIYDPRRALIYQRLGIPTVATVTWTTEQVRRRLIPNTTSTEWSDPTGDVSIVERSLPDSLAGKSLAPLMSADDYRLVMITRAGKARLASPDLVGQEGDRLVLAVNTAAIDQLSSPEWMAAAPAGQH
jgi:trk system potassium uptake protein TrkA